MTLQPTLTTPRLIIRPFRPEDAPDIKRLLDDPIIAATTARIPHPYELENANQFIAEITVEFDSGRGITCAITIRSTGELIGVVSLRIESYWERAELGYWIGVSHWSNGFATEAAAAMVEYGFRNLGLNRLYAWFFPDNPASGRVLEKIGMQREGLARQHLKKSDGFKDAVLMGLLRQEWEHNAR